MSLNDEKSKWMRALQKGTITQEQYDRILDDIESLEDDTFTVTNEQTGNSITVNSSANLHNLNALLDAVSADDMLKKAAVEQNPKRKRMMLLYARRKAEIENSR